MSWFKKALDAAVEVSGDYLENMRKDPLGTFATMGIKPGIDTAEEDFNKFKERNGGRTGRMKMDQANAAIAADNKAQLDKAFQSESNAAAARYSGGDIFTSLTNTSVTSPNKKKSILGGF